MRVKRQRFQMELGTLHTSMRDRWGQRRRRTEKKHSTHLKYVIKAWWRLSLCHMQTIAMLPKRKTCLTCASVRLTFEKFTLTNIYLQTVSSRQRQQQKNTLARSFACSRINTNANRPTKIFKSLWMPLGFLATVNQKCCDSFTLWLLVLILCTNFENHL